MAKRIIAVTQINHDGENFPANEHIDVTKFTKSQLESLYDVGAIKIEDVENVVKDSTANKNITSEVSKKDDISNTLKSLEPTGKVVVTEGATTKVDKPNGESNAK